jgi:hypothetical protein
MRLRALAAVVVALPLFCTATARADAEVADWFGRYEMNHDGHVGQLVLLRQSLDGEEPWKRWVIRYRDAGETRWLEGKVTYISQKNQRMEFEIEFGKGDVRKFDAYIFSWDKTKMAGTERYRDRTFGFYAFKIDAGDSKGVSEE